MSVTFVPLVSVVEVQMGTAPPGDTYNENGDGTPMIAGAGDYGEIHPQTQKWTTQPTRIAEVDDLIVCVRATIGDLNWADKRYCLGRGVAGLRPRKGKCVIRFLAHYLNFKKRELAALGTGSTFPAIRRGDLDNFPTPAFPLAEQRRIADVLDRAEALRAKRRAALAQLDTLTQAIFTDNVRGPEKPSVDASL